MRGDRGKSFDRSDFFGLGFGRSVFEREGLVRSRVFFGIIVGGFLMGK